MYQILKNNKMVVLGIIFLSILTVLLVYNRLLEVKYSDAVQITDGEIKNNVSGDVNTHFINNKKANEYILIFGIFSTIVTIIIGIIETRKKYIETSI